MQEYNEPSALIEQMKLSFPHIVEATWFPTRGGRLNPTESYQGAGNSLDWMPYPSAIELTPFSEDTTPAHHTAPATDYVLLLVLRSKKAKQEILATLHELSKQSGISVEPLLISEREYRKSMPGVWDSPLTGTSVLSLLQRQTNDVYAVRRHFLAALDSLSQMLQRLNQESPISGLHAWSVGKQLELAYQYFLEWTWALAQREPPPDGFPFASSEELVSHLCREGKLFEPEFLHFSTRLYAFLRRQQMLALLAPLGYGDEESELRALVESLQTALFALRKRAEAILCVPVIEAKRKRTMRWVIGTTLTLLLLCSVGGVVWYRQSFLLPLSTPPPAKKVGGMVGSYYQGTGFNKLLKTYTNTTLNMFWAGKAAHDLPADQFSVRWDGYLLAPKEGSYRMCLDYDDGGRVWVGDKLQIDDWRGGHLRTKCKRVQMKRGWHKLKVEFFEFTGPATLRLKWKIPGLGPMDIVGSRYLCCKP